MLLAVSNPPRATAALGTVVALAALAGALAPRPAVADTLQAATFTEHVYANGLFHGLGVDPSRPESFTEAVTLADASAAGSVATAGGALPRAEGALTITAIGNPTRVLWGSFEARVIYEWQVEQVGGGPFDGTVPVLVHTRGGVDSAISRPGFAEIENLWAQAKIVLPGTGLPSSAHVAQGCLRGVCTYGPIAFDDRFVGAATPGTAYTVDLTAYGLGTAQADTGRFTMSAWVDPVIVIDPGFDRRDDFRIAFSAGVTAVPEPATAVLALLGLAAVGGVVRRRA